MLPCLFLTRPEVDSARFARAARDAGWRGDVLIAPLLHISLTPPPAARLDSARTLIATSQNAIAALAAASPRRDWPIWCVGPRTAEAARAAGFDIVHEGGGDAQALRAALLQAALAEPVLHLRGTHAAMDVAAELRAAGVATESCRVYQQIAQPLSDAGQARLKQGGDLVIPVFSPRSAQLVVAALREAAAPEARLHVLAISKSALSAAQGVDWASARVAERPDATAMLAALTLVQAALEPSEKPR